MVGSDCEKYENNVSEKKFARSVFGFWRQALQHFERKSVLRKNWRTWKICFESNRLAHFTKLSREVLFNKTTYASWNARSFNSCLLCALAFKHDVRAFLKTLRARAPTQLAARACQDTEACATYEIKKTYFRFKGLVGWFVAAAAAANLSLPLFFLHRSECAWSLKQQGRPLPPAAGPAQLPVFEQSASLLLPAATPISAQQVDQEVLFSEKKLCFIFSSSSRNFSFCAFRKIPFRLSVSQEIVNPRIFCFDAILWILKFSIKFSSEDNSRRLLGRKSLEVKET